MPAPELSPWAALATAMGVGNLVQFWLARPGQKVKEQQELINSMIQSAQATPALVIQARELLNANAELQATIFTQKNNFEAVTDRVGALEKDVKTLTARCEELGRQADQVPGLEMRNHDLETALAQKDALISDLHETVRQKDDKITNLQDMLTVAAAGQQMAEGVAKHAEKQAERIISGLLPPQTETTDIPH